MKNCTRFLLKTLLAAIGLTAAGAATAQPHRQPSQDNISVPTPAQDVWLRRLVGNYKLDGMVIGGDCSRSPPPCSAIKGRIDCAAVGDGPGVQCIINATWLDDLNPYLDPAMSLYGVDPGKSAINFLLITDRSLPVKGFGTVKGHFGAFRTLCRGTDEDGCEVGIRIEARPDANINYMWIGDNIVITMRRVQPEDSRPPDRTR